MDRDPGEAAGTAMIEVPANDAGRRRMAIALLAGPMEDGRAYRPPPWPPPRAPETPDEAALCDAVTELGLDVDGYRELKDEALELVTSERYDRLHRAIRLALEQHGHLDERAISHIKAVIEENLMEHLTKAATVTAVDRGEFTAIAAAYSVDRQNDQIIRGAFANTINRWRASGMNLPVHWNHDGAAANVIGYIDPAAMRETDQGLEVSGKLDLADSDTAREAWRSMRNNAMSLSFGFLTIKSYRRDDDINELHELDLSRSASSPPRRTLTPASCL